MVLPLLRRCLLDAGSRCALENFAPVSVTVPVRFATKQISENDFFVKNKELNRPISPYTVYKMQITSIMSISHRITGVGLSLGIYGLGLTQLFTSSSFPQQLSALSVIPSPLIYLIKIAAVTSFGYHFANGIRHLIWDAGFGFGLKELYTSGYVVLAITLAILLYSIAEYR